MTVRVLGEPFDPWQELARHESTLAAQKGIGATAVFVGTTRDFNQSDEVRAMRLEHYPGMTERELERIEAEARKRWPLDEVLIVHRYGMLTPGEPIVVVAAWSAHRDAAFAACRYLIEELKTRATFWKQEDTGEGHRWVRPAGG